MKNPNHFSALNFSVFASSPLGQSGTPNLHH
jgi:hypothetical protein